MQGARRRCSIRRLMRRPSCSSATWTAARARPMRAAHPPPTAPRATAPPCDPVTSAGLVKLAQRALARHLCCRPGHASPSRVPSQLEEQPARRRCVLCPLAHTARPWARSAACRTVVARNHSTHIRGAQPNFSASKGCLPRHEAARATTSPEPTTHPSSYTLTPPLLTRQWTCAPKARARLELLEGRPLVGVARPALAHDRRQRRWAAGRDDRPQTLLHHAHRRLRHARTIQIRTMSSQAGDIALTCMRKSR